MNDHEAQRIAAAMHVARPDWPTASVLTLIRKNLLDRPRRDVFVALAWVASEPNTSTPARVLETGPWWRAAGIEGSTQPRREYDPRETCAECNQTRDYCRTVWPDDHEFLSVIDHKRRLAANPVDAARIREALAAELRPAEESA